MNESKKQRAKNLIWLGANDYNLEIGKEIYKDEEVSIYGNLILGGITKIHDKNIIFPYIEFLSTMELSSLFLSLIWIPLEEGSYENLLIERPFLKALRENYGKEIKNKYKKRNPKNMEEEFELAHGNRILGIYPKLGPYGEELFNNLLKLKNLDSESFIKSFTDILDSYFIVEKGKIESKTKKIIEEKKKDSMKYDEKNINFSEQMNIGGAEFTTNIFEDMEGRKDKDKIKPYEKKKYSDKNLNDYIIENFGLSIISERKKEEIEKYCATDIHKGQHIHITNGELPEHMDDSFRKKEKLRQYEKNIAYYNKNKSKILRSINKLSNTLKNTILTQIDDSIYKSKEGKLDPSQIWRGYYLNDQRIFTKERKDSLGNMNVNILLDSSASQKDRQEIVASQGYIISESLNRAKIKHRIWTFSSMKGYTILTLLKDYNDKDNKNIFTYFATAANRDGLAIKTILYLEDKSVDENQTLIILTDGKPNDQRININTNIDKSIEQYTGNKALINTASEIRKGRNTGKSILGVFYGEDKDIDKAKFIYGNNFARIKNFETFSDIVGKFLKEEIKK